MKKYFDTVITSTGQPAIGVSVQVNNYPSLTAATIYSDNGFTPKTNPITTDATGYFEFYVADGRYQINISGTGIVTRQINDVVIEDYADMTGPLTITDNSSSPAIKITQTGTGNALVVEDAASDTTPFVVDASGNVGIGNLAEANVVLSVRGAQRNHRHSANDAAPIYHANVKSRGTYGAQLTVNNGDSIAAYQSYAYDGSGERQSASIVMQVDGVPATSTVPGRIVFSTAPAGTSQAPLERLRIDSSGNVLVKSAAGIGYGTGAGGTVTQVTSKSTGVTLHKPCGTITTTADALAAGASVTFIVTNSLVAATDVVIINLVGGVGASANYRVENENTNAGLFRVRVTNLSAGSLSEALVINFVVIKGAIA